MEQHDIGWAVDQLRLGRRVYRRGWNGEGQHLGLMAPGGDMTLPYVYIKVVGHHVVPWLCSQTDLLADDWEVR